MPKLGFRGIEYIQVMEHELSLIRYLSESMCEFFNHVSFLLFDVAKEAHQFLAHFDDVSLEKTTNGMGHSCDRI